MNINTFILFLLIIISLSGCSMSNIKQSGGRGSISGKIGNSNVVQPDNASSAANIIYNEDGVKIPLHKDDEISIIVNKTDTESTTKIEFKPKNSSVVEVFSSGGHVSTGKSYEDVTGKLNVFMQNIKLILWVGIGFIVAGGIFAGIMRDIRSGIILGGIGCVMLIGYSILPQLYSNYLIIVSIGIVAIPVIWYFNYKKMKRVTKASIVSHEEIKKKNPDVAKESSNEFKKYINPEDENFIKQLRDGF